MRTDHCMATRCAAAPCEAKRSGWASRCNSFQRASMVLRSCANWRGSANSSKSSDCRFMSIKSRQHRSEGGRSEEHTSELQSPDHLVCRLLLEKKKISIYSSILFLPTQYTASSKA